MRPLEIRGQHLLYSDIHPRRLQIAHAGVIDRAFAQHAGAARHGMDDQLARSHPACGNGAVSCSLVGPKIAASGTPTAAATCIAPESFDTHASASAMTPASDSRLVRPHRSSTRDRSLSGTISAMARVVSPSEPLPTSAHCAPRSVMRVVANSAKCRGNQRFAVPYAAPGANTTRGAPSSHPPPTAAPAPARAPREVSSREARAVRWECRAREPDAGSRPPDGGCQVALAPLARGAARAYRRRTPIAPESRPGAQPTPPQTNWAAAGRRRRPRREGAPRRAGERQVAPAAHATPTRRPRRQWEPN